ncbi:integration host factor, actinobacterial type [Streptomyces sp. 7N604]|uniref:integration host factor, actinobacterial type n=1 Tax=Streptomyces sp. 7N604 TaxID=3457415 RepID=UPI003FCEEC57
MSLPALSADDRAKALQKAIAVRQQRAELLASVKSGRLSLPEFLTLQDPVAGKTPVRRLLEALPSIGRVRAEQIMKEIGVPDGRRVQGLGSRQRRLLIERFPARG